MTASSERRPTCVIVVGSTGLGKSSLIKALSGSDVHVSKGALSDTKDARVFRDVANNRILLDTMGAEDSDEKESDEAILRKVLYAIQQESIDDIKIVWIVKKETRKTSSLMVQARFIQSFCGDATDSNPWDSVILLVKEGENLPPEEEDLDSQGALAAAAQFGANYRPRNSDDDIPLADVPRFGYTCVDWLVGRKRERKLKAVANQSFDDRFEEGVLLESEIVVRVNELLEARPALDMKFKKQKCTTCGVEGDSRCVPVECHERSIRVHPKINELMHLEEAPRHVHPFALQKYHSQPIENFHAGSTRNVHRGNIVHSHKGQVEYYHSGSASGSHRGTLEWAHSGSQEYYHDGSTYGEEVQNGVHHPGDLREVCPRGHPCGLEYRTTEYTAESGQDVTRVQCGICGRTAGERYTEGPGEGNPIGFQHCRMCCDVYDHLSRWGNDGVAFTCPGTIPSILQDVCSSQLAYQYACCEGSSGSTGCTPSYTSVYKYRCCDRADGSNGCRIRMSCCGDSPSARGCDGRYSCCHQAKGSTGCQSRYSCCDRLSSGEGCKRLIHVAPELHRRPAVSLATRAVIELREVLGANSGISVAVPRLDQTDAKQSIRVVMVIQAVEVVRASTFVVGSP